MKTLTIEIPEKVLQSGNRRRLVVVDPRVFAKELRRQWETEDAIKASRAARREWREGKARLVSDLKELIK